MMRRMIVEDAVVGVGWGSGGRWEGVVRWLSQLMTEVKVAGESMCHRQTTRVEACI